MNIRTEILTPIGRLVQGSLYEPNTKDALGNPLVIKSGSKAGQERVSYFMAIAIPKNNHLPWQQTDFGMKMTQVAQRDFPNGQSSHFGFAWKLIDGDDTVPNKRGNKPCDQPGFKGCWILKFSGGFAPLIYDTRNNLKQMLEKDAVNLGDYIQIFGHITGNNSSQQPGVYLNHQMVGFIGYGERIVLMGTPDPKSVGFGGSLPQGASLTPLAASNFNPSTQPLSTNPNQNANTAPSSPVQPHHGILNPSNLPPLPQSAPSLPVQPQRIMTPKAGNFTYDDYIAIGWSETQLRAEGMML